MNEHPTSDREIEWESVFERITGNREAPVSHLVLSHHLEHTHNLDSDEAWQAVYEASERGELLQVIVERFPDVHRKYYFIPRNRFEYAGQIFVPFWDYVLEEVIQGDGRFIRSDLHDWILKRNGGDVSERELSAIDEHLAAITPAYTPKQSMNGTKIRSDTMRLYQKLYDVTGTTNTEPSDLERGTQSI